jgi:hypothetical protein
LELLLLLPLPLPPPLLPHAASTRLVKMARPPTAVPRHGRLRKPDMSTVNRDVGNIGVSLLFR